MNRNLKRSRSSSRSSSSSSGSSSDDNKDKSRQDTVGVLPVVDRREVEVEVGTIINKEEIEMIVDK